MPALLVLVITTMLLVELVVVSLEPVVTAAGVVLGTAEVDGLKLVAVLKSAGRVMPKLVAQEAGSTP